MNNTKSPRFLECLIGLQCQVRSQVRNNGTDYLIIDVDPETKALVLFSLGNFRRAMVTEILLNEKSQGELRYKIYNQRRQ